MPAKSVSLPHPVISLCDRSVTAVPQESPDFESGPVTVNVRRTLTLDSDVIEEFGGDSDDRRLSPEINAVLRAEKKRRRRGRSLDAMLNRLEAERGPVDPNVVEEFERYLQ